jgi:NADH-quinone oxidoreductase subunit M
VLQMINHGLSTGALFLIVGLVYERRHTRLISEYGGLSKQMPVFAVLFMIITMSSIGLPSLNGFIGEFTILAGAFEIPGQYGFSLPWLGGLFIGGKFWVCCGVLGIVLGAAYMLWLYQRTMFGKLDNPENAKLKDLNFREVMTIVPIVACCIWIGLFPSPFFRILDRPVADLVQRLEAPAGMPVAEAPHGFEPGDPAPGTPRVASTPGAALAVQAPVAAAENAAR